MIRMFLLILGLLTGLGGLAIFGGAESPIHEIEAFVLFVVSAVLISGAAIVDVLTKIKRSYVDSYPSVGEQPKTERSTEPRSWRTPLIIGGGVVLLLLLFFLAYVLDGAVSNTDTVDFPAPTPEPILDVSNRELLNLYDNELAEDAEDEVGMGASDPASAKPSTPSILVVAEAAVLAPDIDYFGIGWQESGSGVNTFESGLKSDGLVSGHTQSFVRTQPPTQVAINISVFSTTQLAKRAFASAEDRHRMQGKDRLGVGDEAFRVRTEYMAEMLEETYMRRNNVLIQIRVARSGFGLEELDAANLARNIDKQILAAPKAPAPNPTSASDLIVVPTMVPSKVEPLARSPRPTAPPATNNPRPTSAPESTAPESTIEVSVTPTTLAPTPTPPPPTATPSPTPVPIIGVTKTSDTNDGKCNADCSLREAIAAASPGYEVRIPAGVYTLPLGVLKIDKDLTLAGAGAEDTIVQAAVEPGRAEYRVFNINRNGNVLISGVTIRHGEGGIENWGELTLERSIVTANQATPRGGSNSTGGGIWNSGSLTVVESTISRNTAPEKGAGIFSSSGVVTITRSILAENVIPKSRVRGVGGGISSDGGSITITRSVVSRNEAYQGGGIYANNVAVNSSTISGNVARWDGGGVYSDTDSITLTNSTVSGNTAQRLGGGICGIYGSSSIINTTITENHAGGFGGGLYMERGQHPPKLANTIISGNTAPKRSPLIYDRAAVIRGARITKPSSFKALPEQLSEDSDGQNPM